MYASNKHLSTKMQISNQSGSGLTNNTNAAGLDSLTSDEVTLIVDIDNSGTNAFGTYVDGSTVKPSVVNKVKIVTKHADGTLKLSDTITVANITKLKNTLTTNANEKVSYIGYNTNVGTIEAVTAAATDMIIRFELLSQGHSTPGYPFYKDAAYRTVIGSESAGTVSAGLVKSCIENFDREKTNEQFMMFERVANGTYGTSTTSSSVINNSKIVSGFGLGTSVNTITSTLTGTTQGINVPVRIGGSSATTTPVYLATYVDANTISLDVPYQGTTATTNVYVQSVEPTLWGIKCTGVPRKWSNALPTKFKYQKADWNTQLGDNFLTTTVTNTTGYSLGAGTRQQIADLEYELQLNEKMAIVAPAAPQIIFSRNTNLGGTSDVHNNTGYYDLLEVEWYDDNTTNLVGPPNRAYKKFILASYNATQVASQSVGGALVTLLTK